MPKPNADKKKRRTFALSDTENDLLFLIGKINGLGMSSSVGQFARSEAKRLKISLDDPAMQELLKKRTKKSD